MAKNLIVFKRGLDAILGLIAATGSSTFTKRLMCGGARSAQR